MNEQKINMAASAGAVEAEMVLWEQVEAVELDEMWSFAGNKGCQRWLWLAIDRKTRAVLAYVFGQKKDKVFMELKTLLEPFGIRMFHIDDWCSYGTSPTTSTRQAKSTPRR